MYHFIINPASRSGKGLRIWEERIEPILIREQVPYLAHFSQGAGGIAEITRELCASGPTPVKIIVLGGDGTLNEALQGIDHPEDVILGFIPSGSGNDLARDLGIPRSPEKALDIILHSGRTRTMDLGLLITDTGSFKFLTGCGIGFDAAVCEEMLHSGAKSFFNRIGLGKLTYLMIALKQLVFMPRAHYTLTLDDSAPIHTDSGIFIAGMLHRYEGGGFMFCPKATGTDGYFHLCCVGNLSVPLILCALPTAFFGKHYAFKEIKARKATSYTITTSRSLWVHTDGEVIELTDSIRVTCLPQALKMLVP